MKTTNKRERDSFKNAIVTEMKRLDTTDIWKAVLSLFSKHEEKYILCLKADLPIIEALVKGFSTSSVANTFAISSKDVFEVSNTWGITPLDFTLDFNPLMVYNIGMTVDSFLAEMNDYLPIPLSRETASIAISNILRYFDLLEFIMEEENG